MVAERHPEAAEAAEVSPSHANGVNGKPETLMQKYFEHKPGTINK